MLAYSAAAQPTKAKSKAETDPRLARGGSLWLAAQTEEETIVADDNTVTHNSNAAGAGPAVAAAAAPSAFVRFPRAYGDESVFIFHARLDRYVPVGETIAPSDPVHELLRAGYSSQSDTSRLGDALYSPQWERLSRLGRRRRQGRLSPIGGGDLELLGSVPFVWLTEGVGPKGVGFSRGTYRKEWLMGRLARTSGAGGGGRVFQYTDVEPAVGTFAASPEDKAKWRRRSGYERFSFAGVSLSNEAIRDFRGDYLAVTKGLGRMLKGGAFKHVDEIFTHYQFDDYYECDWM